MTSYIDSIFRVRDLLRNPYPQAPSFHQLLRQCLSDQADIANELNNSGKTWTVNEYQLNFNGVNDTYDIDTTDFGKVLFVVRILSGNPYVRALPVLFDDLTELDYGTLIAPFNSLYSAWIPPMANTVERMAFFQTGNVNPQWKVRIQPLPQQACTYIISYAAGWNGDSNPLNSLMLMPSYVTMSELRSAKAMLSYSEWFEDEMQNVMRRKQLDDSYDYQLNKKEPQFAKYIKSMNHPRMVEVGYEDDY